MYLLQWPVSYSACERIGVIMDFGFVEVSSKELAFQKTNTLFKLSLLCYDGLTVVDKTGGIFLREMESLLAYCNQHKERHNNARFSVNSKDNGVTVVFMNSAVIMNIVDGDKV